MRTPKTGSSNHNNGGGGAAAVNERLWHEYLQSEASKAPILNAKNWTQVRWSGVEWSGRVDRPTNGV